MYGLQMFETWLYDDKKPFEYLELEETYKELKKEVETSYYEELLQTALLENKHKSIVVVRPVRGLTGKREKALADRLAAKKAAMSKEEVEAVIAQTQALADYQEEVGQRGKPNENPTSGQERYREKGAPLL